ncbi:MAG: CoA transferase, partial [Chloroflexi bacterium]|nr:CoA transferase [Chloroflexota bacterium]
MKESSSNLRVVEIGQGISAPYCTKLLVDIGADVLKIEFPGTGDFLRSIGSFPDNLSDPTKGALFEYLNAGKSSAVLDLSLETDVKVLLEAIAKADILIEDLGRGILEKHGIDFSRLKKANRNIAVVRISDFGQDGPYASVPATDFTVQAAAGWVWKHYAPGRNPVQVGGRVTDFITGVYSACAALTAHRITRRLDTSVMVDISKHECLHATLSQPALQTQVLQEMGWGPQEDRVFPIPGVMKCADGLVGINLLTARHFEDFCNLVGIPQHIPNQIALQLAGPLLDAFHRDVQPWVSERSLDEIVDILQSLRIPAVPVSNGRTLPELAQLKLRGFYKKYPDTGFLQPVKPWRIKPEPEFDYHRAPRLPEHGVGNSEIWQPDRESSRTLEATAGNDNTLPFSGLKVIDMGIMWAGPYVGCYLGAFGADVIKVESIQRPDPFRFSGSFMEMGSDWYERSALFQGTNLNKRDLTLNLNQDEGKRIFEKLVAQSDVLLENFSPRVLENFGFGPERLHEINPKLIILRMPGFGLEGPCKDYVSFAMSIEQASGMAYVTGRPNELPLNP